MHFDVLSSRVHFSKWGDGHSAVVTFDVVPSERAYLEIGEDYVLAGNWHLRIHEKERQAVNATVTVVPDIEPTKRSGDETRTIGTANFYREREDDVLGGEPPSLLMQVAVPPHIVDELIRMRIERPGSATIYVDIDDLEFGWEPDGSHQVWKLDDEPPRYGPAGKKSIGSFSFNLETFSTSERAMSEEEDRRTNEWLADSPDPEAQRTAALANPPPKDEAVDLLRQLRIILIALLVVAVLAFLQL